MPDYRSEADMYARIVTMSFGPEGLDASIRFFDETVLPGIRGLPGFRGATFLVNRYDHILKSLTYWDAPGHLQESAEAAGRMHQVLTDTVEGMETVSVEVFEVAVDVTADPVVSGKRQF